MNSSDSSEKRLEPMADFFTARIDGYEAHMLKNGYIESYRKFAETIPATTKTMLDLGCGTGLELDWIFPQLPDIAVTGIDLAQAMLDKLKQKYPSKNLNLICGSYFDVDFGQGKYDTVISYCTLHHFSHVLKLGLYRKIIETLKSGGVYIEADYMIEDQSEEDKYFEENARIRKEQNIPETAFYHFDTPCTVNTQMKLLKQAGFSSTTLISRHEKDAIITCRK